MDRTERFRGGRLLLGDLMVMEKVEGSLKTHLGAGSTSEWTGHFFVPPDMREKILEGHRYRLVLIDGRSGTIAVHMNAPDPVEQPLAKFHGKGAYRR